MDRLPWEKTPEFPNHYRWPITAYTKALAQIGNISKLCHRLCDGRMRLINEEINGQGVCGGGGYRCAIQHLVDRLRKITPQMFRSLRLNQRPCLYPEPQMRPHLQTSNTPRSLPSFPKETPPLDCYIPPITSCRKTEKPRYPKQSFTAKELEVPHPWMQALLQIYCEREKKLNGRPRC